MSPETQCWSDRNWCLWRRGTEPCSVLLLDWQGDTILIAEAGEMYQREKGSVRAAQKVFPLSCTFFGFPPFFPASLGEHTVNTCYPKPLPLKSSILKCQEGGIQPHHLGVCSCAALPAGKVTPGLGGSTGHRAGASPSSWGCLSPWNPLFQAEVHHPWFWQPCVVAGQVLLLLTRKVPGHVLLQEGRDSKKLLSQRALAIPPCLLSLSCRGHQAAHVCSHKKGDPAAAEPIALPEMSFWRAPNRPLLLWNTCI